jgi:hypothetical protein
LASWVFCDRPVVLGALHCIMNSSVKRRKGGASMKTSRRAAR